MIQKKFHPSSILFLIFGLVFLIMAMASCRTPYENRKGHGCMGATGIAAARPSHR